MNATPEIALETERRATGFLLLLSIAHGVIDMGQGTLYALLPLLREEFNLSYTAVGTILLCSQLTSSVAQPIFGVVSDRAGGRWLVPASLFVGGLGLASLGYMPSYVLVLLGVVMASLGVAAFHPEGAHAAHLLAGARQNRAMGIYSVGGNLGNAVGPVYAGMLVALAGGLRGTGLALLIPGGLALLIWRLLPAWHAQEAQVQRAYSHRTGPTGENNWGGASMVTLLVVLRSMIHMGVVSYIPFYWIDILGHSKQSAVWVQLMYLMAGAAGTLWGAPLADKIGTKRVVVASFVLLLPVQIFMPKLAGLPLLIALSVAGFLVVSTFTTTLVMTQEYMPKSLGLASGLNLGLGFGMGGVGAWLLGMIADRWGIQAGFWSIAALVVPSIVVAVLLPAVRRVRKGE